MTYTDFFRQATHHDPYHWQIRLACGEPPPEANHDLTHPDPATLAWLRGTSLCSSHLIDIPTGLGKTAGVVLAWLWNYLESEFSTPLPQPQESGHSCPLLKTNSSPTTPTSPSWPRRLVYCLPMRTLVEQTAGEVETWLWHLLSANPQNTALRWLCGIGDGDPTPANPEPTDAQRQAIRSPVILMGGEDLAPAKRDWGLYPEKPCLLIGTQDMLLSRALNRGYGMSRYRWPMHFALLNNDCLWVMDETQLMGVGVETSAQLDGFRHDGKMPTVGVCPTWWMSATLNETRLATVDHPKPPDSGWTTLALSEMEKTSGRPNELITAPKKLSPAPVALNATTKANYPKQLATLIKERHLRGTLTLVVVNRVSRARDIFAALIRQEKKGRQTLPALYDPERVALVHSRFRPKDRAQHEALLFGNGDRIVIATQAVEAGVDVSARLLITELAPWSSLVQRMGRCNRRAEFSDAEVLWVDIEPKDEKDDLLLPYTGDELGKARAAISSLTDASPQSLSDVSVAEGKVIRPVIRRRDLIDLFDTTPDLCGQDLDISRYIRDGDDNDAQFFWRDLQGDLPLENEPAPVPMELCRVSIGEAAKFLKNNKVRAWRWNPLDEKWETATNARPGTIYLVDAESGGYHDALGWTGDPKDKPTSCPPKDGTLERYAGNPLSLDREWQTLSEHTAKVVSQTSAITTSLNLKNSEASTLHRAALWHDIGKAHEHFQKMLRDGPQQPVDPTAFYAKSKNPPNPAKAAKDYRSLRHELASALAWLLGSPHDAPERDLTAYLIAAHHGKVRLSIRSLPNEPAPDDDRLFARGIWDGDPLPAVPLGAITTPALTLDLRFMRMGESELGPSWLARSIALRDRFGPFRLAYLETLLRIADARASALASSDEVAHSLPRELAEQHRPLAETSAAGQNPPPLGNHPGAGGPEHGLRGRAGEFADPSRDTCPERATRFLETTRGILSYSQLAPLLAGQVVAVQADIERGVYGPRTLEESLLLDFHRRIAGDLVPDWAGRWRPIAVRVGNLQPPAPHAVPARMRDYCLDLQARWPAASSNLGDLTLDFLAFAEGRFLTVHPFQDFNGRVIRLFLSELLRRLDLPPVRLEAEGESERATYFAALEAADQNDFRPLVEIWKQRLADSDHQPS